MKPGTLFIISAPSGAGKTTMLKQVMVAVPGLAFSVSHTTRSPRAGEKDGTDYYFVDREAFLAMREQGDFLEWAEVHGNFYGTSRAAVEKSLVAGVDIVLDIDVQGARQIRKSSPGAVAFIFIAPPSWEELEKRLSGRGTDGPETIRLRLANARKEMADIDFYDYVVVNDDLARAVDSLRAVIIAERSKSRRLAAGAPMNLPVVET